MHSGYIRADYDRPELHWRTVSGDTDLFGDGLIRLVETRATPPAGRPAGLARERLRRRSASSQRSRKESTCRVWTALPDPSTSRHVTQPRPSLLPHES